MRACWARKLVKSLRQSLEDGVRWEERKGGTNSTPNLECNQDAWQQLFLCFQWPPGEANQQKCPIPVLVLALPKIPMSLLRVGSVSYPGRGLSMADEYPSCWWSVWVLVWCQVMGSPLLLFSVLKIRKLNKNCWKKKLLKLQTQILQSF